MTMIRREVLLCTDMDKPETCRKLPAIFDTGATYSHINSDLLSEFKEVYRPRDKTVRIELAVEGQHAEVVGDVLLYPEIEGCQIEHPQVFRVTKNLKNDVIIGADIMESLGIILDPKEDTVRFKKCPPDVGLF